MSCGIALSIALMVSNPAVAEAASQPPAAAGAPVSVAGEPLFADIIARSTELKALVDGWAASKAADAEGFFAGPVFTGFKARADALSQLDMQGHLILKERGTAPTPAERAVALSELSYLLNDNVEVITAPPQPEV